MSENIKNKTAKNTVFVSAIPHPFSEKNIQLELTQGLNISQILEELQPDPLLRKHAHVYIDDLYIEKDNWDAVYPKSGDNVVFRLVPMGGGNGSKNPLVSILAIVSSFVIPGAVPGIWGTILSTGVKIVGGLALNALAPHGKPKSNFIAKDSPTLFLQGASNEINPFGKVPKVLGRHRFIPPFAAKPYTETIGDDQYIRMLFCLGYGPVNITDLKIGETDLAEFDDVEIEITNGYPDDPAISLFKNTVLQNDLNIKLTNEDGYVVRTTDDDITEISLDITFPKGLANFDETGAPLIHEVDFDVQYAISGTDNWSIGSDHFTEIAGQSVSGFTAPGVGSSSWGSKRYNKLINSIVIDRTTGLVNVLTGDPGFGFDVDGLSGRINPKRAIIPNGKILIADVIGVGSNPILEVIDRRYSNLFGDVFKNSSDFAVSQSGSLININAGELKFHGIYISSSKTASFRRSVRFSVPKGKYDVRVKRITADAEDSRVFDESYWTALRGYRDEDPVNTNNIAFVALRIKATDQLNGVVDRFNAITSSVVNDFDDGVWDLRASSNPAALFREVLQGSANLKPLSDERIDLDKLEEWYVDCLDNGYEYNSVIDYAASVYDILSDIAAVGRASVSLVDGKWSIVQDRPQSVPVQHFTPRNSFKFTSEKSFAEIPEGLRILFTNRDNGWLQDELMVFDDGYSKENATIYQSIELPGVTSPDQAYKDARYHLASARLRPELYSFSADIEHIICNRGDLILFSHDVPLVGILSARVKAVNYNGDQSEIISVEIDSKIEMESSKSYAARFRLQNGDAPVYAIDNSLNYTNILTFSEIVSSSNSINIGDLLSIGEAGSETVEMIIKSIEPSSDLTAKITCVDASPAIHLADIGEIPEFNSNITIPTELKRPDKPIVTSVQTGEETLVISANNAVSNQIIIKLSPPDIEVLELKVQIRKTGEDSFADAKLLLRNNGQVNITDILEGSNYDVKLQYMTSANILSEPTIISNILVNGLGGLPDDVENFNISINGNSANLSWDRVNNLDLSHYKIKHSSLQTGATWGTSIDLVDNVSNSATSITLPSKTGTYLIKAVDFGGRESANASLIISNISDVQGLNIVSELIETPDFSGAKTNIALMDGELRLSSIDAVDDWVDVDNLLNFDIGEDGILTEGFYYFDNDLDLGAVYTSNLSANIGVRGLDLLDIVDNWNNIDTRLDFDGDLDPSDYGIELQVCYTSADPVSNPIWSDWKKFIIGEYQARAFEFRVKFISKEFGISPAISDLSVTIDMPDRNESGNNITASISGEVIAFANPFKATPSIHISAEDMATGDYFEITGKANTGFTVKFFDSSNIGISRTFDWVAVGYGIESYYLL